MKDSETVQRVFLVLRRFGAHFVCGLAVLLSLAAIPVHAQSSIAGTVIGQVTDESGAAVPGVSVKIVEPATGTSFTTVTNDTGRFEFATVAPGKYDINFSKTGFSEFNIRSQEIKIGIVLTANATLKIGSTATTVEVSASVGAELQTMNATVGNTINQTSLMVLPNLGRDASTMAVFQPATSPTGNAAGAVADLNTYQLDGANITDDMSGNVTTYQTNFTGTGGSQTNGLPSPVIPTPIESIEEFKVSVSNQTADFNNSSGAQVQMTTKRGTSQFHGAAYMFYYDNAIGQANYWSNNHTPFTFGSTSFPDTPVDYPKNHRSRFGGALGGPLLPKSFLGGKWFFFTNYEGSRFPNAGTYSVNVPSAALRQGIIQIPNSAGTIIPYNLSNVPVSFNGQVLQPAQCGTGPCDPRGLGVNPIVSQIWNNQIPLPNNLLNGDGFGNTYGFLATLRQPLTTNNYVGRIDHDFGDKEHFYLTYRDYKLVNLTNNQVDIGGVLPGDKLGIPTALAPRPQQPSVWTAGLVSTISPTVTNTFVFDYLRQFWQWSDAAGPAQLSSLGGALEIGGENTTSPGWIPYNVNSQSIRQRFWDGQDKWLKDDVSMLRGNHLFQFGGSYGRNFDYHSRSDNGAGVNNQISYLSTNSGIFTSSGTTYIPSTVPSAQYTNYENYYSYVLGLLSSTQVMYTRQLPSLSPLPIGTNATDQSVIPYYSVYFQDTWHMKPSFTLTYGLGWNLEMPPYELNGKQVALVDGSGQPVNVQSFLAQRNKAALAGGNYYPQLGYELVRNVGTGLKYPYNPYYAEFSPHVAFAWNPHYDSGIMGKLFGNGKTVIRGGYSRIFGRLNGVDLVLVPLLGPGMLQGVTCVNPLSNGSCAGSGNATPATAFRIGTDGLTAPLASPSATLAQPFYPGGNNPTSVDADTLDPNFKPDRTDNFTLTVQREINQHMSLEVGYVGKIIKNEFQNLNLDSVPINETLGGQSFANAFGQLYSQMFFNGVSPANVQAQPFFENVMGGANSAYCKGFASCTAAVASNNSALIKETAVSDLWNSLQKQSSWILGPTTYNVAVNGPNGTSTSIQLNNSLGWGNYNALFFSFHTNDWHGITTTSNFTWSRALGTATVVQASSSFTAVDPFNLAANYGPQGFDYKFVYNTNMYYDVPFFHTQKGILGHILGGWTIAPLFTAQSGAPFGIVYSEGSCTGCEAFGEVTTPGTASLSANSNQHAENAVGYMPYTGGQAAHYGVAGGAGNNVVFGANQVGTALHGNINYGMNMWANPAAVFSEFRPCVLGIDTSCGGGAGPLRTLPTWNLDAQIVKNLNLYKEHLGAQFFFTFTNIMNHFQPSFGNSTTTASLTNPTNFGQITGQSNTPRSLEFGLRLHF